MGERGDDDPDAARDVSRDGSPDAQHAAMEAVTLERALASAREGHPRVGVARAALASATARAAGAGLWPNPNGVLRMESAPVDEGSTSGDAEYVVGISQPVPTGDRLERSRALAASAHEHARRTLDAVVAAVDRQVRGAFGTALYAERVTGVRRELVQTSARRLELVRARVEHGDAVAADLTDVEAQASTDRFELRRAELLGESARHELAHAMGSAADVASVEGDLDEAFDLPAFDELLARLDLDPALLAAEAGTAVARARVDLAEESRAPDLRLDLFYRRFEGTDFDTFDIGLALPLRWFDDGSARVAGERAEVVRTEAEARQIRHTRQAALRGAHIRARRALEHLQVFDAELVPRIQRKLDAEAVRHAAGDVALEPLLVARRLRLEADLRRLEILHEVLAAWAELSSFLGETEASAPP